MKGSLAERQRLKNLEAFVIAFDEFVAAGALYGRIRSPETLERFDRSREILTSLRESLGATRLLRTAADGSGVQDAN